MFQEILHKIRHMRRQKAIILMYHQVCERKSDPWELAVHPDHFYEQLEYLKNNFNVVSVSGLLQRMAENKVADNTVAITFDDGFEDNYLNAAPLLDFFQMPAAFYVSTDHILSGNVYWWDALEDILFHTEVLPRDFEMTIGNAVLTFTFRADQFLQNAIVHQIRAWNYSLPVPNERIRLYMLLWNRIKPLAYAEQNRVLADIGAWVGSTAGTCASARAMGVREVQMLGASPLFSIGAHTVHHCMLSNQDPANQAFEIKESKRQIEEWLGKRVDGFAYPYGNYDCTTQRILKESGFEYAVATEPKVATAGDDRFALPRVQVRNWSVYEFASNLNEMVYG